MDFLFSSNVTASIIIIMYVRYIITGPQGPGPLEGVRGAEANSQRPVEQF